MDPFGKCLGAKANLSPDSNGGQRAGPDELIEPRPSHVEALGCLTGGEQAMRSIRELPRRCCRHRYRAFL
jgi:hypothetical protein